MEVSDIGCAISEHANGHRILSLVSVPKCQSCCKRQMRTHNCVPTPKILSDICQMHGTASSLRATGDLSEQFCQYYLRWNATIDCNAMITVGCDHDVLFLTARYQPRAYCFLTNIEV